MSQCYRRGWETVSKYSSAKAPPSGFDFVRNEGLDCGDRGGCWIEIEGYGGFRIKPSNDCVQSHVRSGLEGVRKVGEWLTESHFDEWCLKFRCRMQ